VELGIFTIWYSFSWYHFKNWISASIRCCAVSVFRNKYVQHTVHDLYLYVIRSR